MIKTKIFSGNIRSGNELEANINNFLSENKAELIDVKFTTLSERYEQLVALLIYQECESQ